VSLPSEDWERLLEGDRVAFVRLSQLVTSFLVSWRAYDFRDEWDDVVDEVIMAAIEASHSGRLRKPAAIVGYLRTATRFKLVDRLRRRRRLVFEPDPPEDSAELHWPPKEESYEGGFEVRDAIVKLPGKQQQALVAVYLEGRTYEEAARDTGIPLGSLKRYLRQGLATLHAQLSELRDES
jgi:RNA polymerase sigma-70 factor (ECF subfamily)